MFRGHAMFGLLGFLDRSSVCSPVDHGQSHEPSGRCGKCSSQRHWCGESPVLDLSGVISAQERWPRSAANMLATFKEEWTRASKDDKIKAVVIRINSPGGTVTASDILYMVAGLQNQEEGSVMLR